jgi:hypothetical protein
MSLLIEIDRYCRVHRMPVSKFGRLAAGDPMLVHDLRRGREPREALRRRVRAFIARQRP